MNEQFSIIWGTRQLNFKQIMSYVSASMKFLRGIGLKAGDRVGIVEENSVEYLILLLAMWQMKVVTAPINPRWPAKTVSSYAASICTAHLFKGEDIKRFVCFDARHDIELITQKVLEMEQELTIISTSGTSGQAKPALHTWGNHYYSAKGSAEIIPLTEQDRWLLALPLYHVAGIAIIVRCLSAGAGVVIDSQGDLAAILARGKVTHVSLVATQLQRLLLDPQNHASLKKLKCILLGGSAIPPALIEQALSLGLNIYLSYGLTEMSSQVATGKPKPRHNACAQVLPYRQLRIAADGEILVRGEVLFKGYITGQRVLLPLTADGYFATGDLGQLDAQGCLTVLGRKDNMFISGGENIHPEEIEKALLSMKGIEQAVVVPREDKEFGSRPIAFIKYADLSLSSEQIIKHLQNELPRFKIPVNFYPWPQELMTSGIKISRKDFLTRI